MIFKQIAQRITTTKTLVREGSYIVAGVFYDAGRKDARAEIGLRCALNTNNKTTKIQTIATKNDW
jgi:hypothetical protein